MCGRNITEWKSKNTFSDCSSERVVRFYSFFLVFIGWAHVVCALYIPEVRFGNVSTMEPIIYSSVPHERFTKVRRKKLKLLALT